MISQFTSRVLSPHSGGLCSLHADAPDPQRLRTGVSHAGYTLAPSGTVDNFSDSGHSEISSRSSIVSNSSFDSLPVSLPDERRQRPSVSIVESSLASGRLERRPAVEPDQYSLG